MLLATTEEQLRGVGLRAALERWLRPAVGYGDPFEVVKDPDLDQDQKRAILASWASDASAVKDQPTMRWLLGTPEPVPLSAVREAMDRLEARASPHFPA